MCSWKIPVHGVDFFPYARQFNADDTSVRFGTALDNIPFLLQLFDGDGHGRQCHLVLLRNVADGTAERTSLPDGLQNMEFADGKHAGRFETEAALQAFE